MLATLGGLLGAALFYNSPKRRSELFESIGRSRWFSNALVGERRSQAADYGIARMRPGPANGQSPAEAPPWLGNSRLAVTPPAASPKSLVNPDRPAVEPSLGPFAVRGAAGAVEPALGHVPATAASRAGSASLGRTAPLGGAGADMPRPMNDPTVQAAGYVEPSQARSVHELEGHRQPPVDSAGAVAEPLAEELDFRQVKSSSRNRSAGAVPQSGDRTPEVSGVRASPGDAAGLKRFTRIERRLRQLGATYYLLESWGAEGHLFRFHCRMAIGGQPHQNRYFEATDEDPLEAMEQVLQEVQHWRFGRSR